MRRLDSAIPFGLQRLTRVTNLCVRECVSNYQILTADFFYKNTSTCGAYLALKESMFEVNVWF